MWLKGNANASYSNSDNLIWSEALMLFTWHVIDKGSTIILAEFKNILFNNIFNNILLQFNNILLQYCWVLET